MNSDALSAAISEVPEKMPALEGGIGAISGRIMTGWIAAGTRAGTSIEFFSDGQPLGSTVAAIVARPGAQSGTDASKTDAPKTEALNFEFLLPRRLFDGASHQISACIAGAAVQLQNNVHRLGQSSLDPLSVGQPSLAQASPEPAGPDQAAANPPEPAQPPVGALDMVTDQGVVNGWAWYPDRRDERVRLEVLVDGQVVGTTIAGLYRGDLAQAGIGDGGCCSFSWPLPFTVLGLSRDVLVAVREQRHGHALGKPLPFRQKIVADALRKIDELENDVRLLSGTIAALERRGAQDNRATAELFKTVGSFFAELAAASEAGESPQSLRTLKTAVEDVTTGLAPFAYRPCTTPDITIFIEAAGPAAAVYRGLRAVYETIGQMQAEIFLLDEGACEDAPLLPLVVQNMRYARLPGEGPVARRNDAMRLAAGRTVVFFAGGVIPAPNWTEALIPFDTHPALAALAARVTGPDGLLSGAGTSIRGGFMTPRGQGEDAQAAAFSQAGPVDAVAAECFAVRRSSWERLGGLDEVFAELPAALAEFCLRAHATGEEITYAPIFTAHQPSPPNRSIPSIAIERADTLRLRDMSEGFRQAAGSAA